MLDYIDEITDSFENVDPTGGGTKSSAAPAIIFKVDKDCDKLNNKKAVEFHHLVIKKCLLPSGTGQTHETQFHSSPQE